MQNRFPNVPLGCFYKEGSHGSCQLLERADSSGRVPAEWRLTREFVQISPGSRMSRLRVVRQASGVFEQGQTILTGPQVKSISVPPCKEAMYSPRIDLRKDFWVVWAQRYATLSLRLCSFDIKGPSEPGQGCHGLKWARGVGATQGTSGWAVSQSTWRRPSRPESEGRGRLDMTFQFYGEPGLVSGIPDLVNWAPSSLLPDSAFRPRLRSRQACGRYTLHSERRHPCYYADNYGDLGQTHASHSRHRSRHFRWRRR